MKTLFLLITVLFCTNYVYAQANSIDTIYTRFNIESRINQAYQFDVDRIVSDYSILKSQQYFEFSAIDKLIRISDLKKSVDYTRKSDSKICKNTLRHSSAADIIQMHILDSIYIINTESLSRQLFYYDAKLNCVKIVIEQFDSSAVLWRPAAVLDFVYNSRNQYIKVDIRLWNKSRGKWSNFDTHIYDYDQKGRIILYKYYEGTTANTYSYKRLKQEYFYLPTSLIYTKSLGINEKWVPRDSIVLKFDANKLLKKEEDYNYDETNKVFVYTTIGEFFYNSSNVVIKSVQSTWDANYNKWRYSRKADYHKNTLGFDSMTVYSTFYYSYWKAENRIKYYTTSYGKPTMMETQYFKDATQSWVYQDKQEMAYDARKREKEYKYFIWDEYNHRYDFYYAYRTDYIIHADDSTAIISAFDKGNYIPYSKDFYSYDSQIPMAQTIPALAFKNKPVDHKLLTEGSWLVNADTTNKQLRYESTYYYSTQDTGSVKIPKVDIPFTVFPNPTNDYVIFQYDDSHYKAEVYLYDAVGRLVLNRKVASNEKLSVKSISVGSYLYKVYLGGDIYVGKLIIY